MELHRSGDYCENTGLASALASTRGVPALEVITEHKEMSPSILGASLFGGEGQI